MGYEVLECVKVGGLVLVRLFRIGVPSPEQKVSPSYS